MAPAPFTVIQSRVNCIQIKVVCWYQDQMTSHGTTDKALKEDDNNNNNNNNINNNKVWI
jgi:hypothetical protein